MENHHFIAIGDIYWAVGATYKEALYNLKSNLSYTISEAQVWYVPLPIEAEYFVGVSRPEVKGAKKVYID